MDSKKLEVIMVIVNNYLKENNYSHREFASKCGFSKSFIWNLVNNKKKWMISYAQMEMLAKGLNMDVEVLTSLVNAPTEEANIKMELINNIQRNEKLLSALEKICSDEELINVVIQISSMNKKELQVVLPVIETISKSK